MLAGLDRVACHDQTAGIDNTEHGVCTAHVYAYNIRL